MSLAEQKALQSLAVIRGDVDALAAQVSQAEHSGSNDLVPERHLGDLTALPNSELRQAQPCWDSSFVEGQFQDIVRIG